MALVVPLQHELDRDRDPRRDVDEPVASDEAEDRGCDPRFGRDEADTHLPTLGQAVVPDRLAGADAVQSLERVQGGLPVGYELRRHDFVEGGPRRAERLARGLPLLDERDEPPDLRMLRPVAGTWRVDRGDREAAGGEVGEGSGDALPPLLVLAPAVPDQDQRTGTGALGRRPEHPGDLPDPEELFAD